MSLAAVNADGDGDLDIFVARCGEGEPNRCSRTTVLWSRADPRRGELGEATVSVSQGL